MRTKAKFAISGTALGFSVLHHLFPKVSIDGVTLVLLVIAVLPWVMPFVKSVQLPGGFKIELQDVKEATSKVVSASLNVVLDSATLRATGTVDPPDGPVVERLRQVVAADDSLALVGAGIEIEKRLRQLAERRGLSTEGRTLGQLLRDVEKAQVLSPQALAGLRDIAALRNRAAHGAPVSPDAAAWVLNTLPAILESLDRIAKGAQ